MQINYALKITSGRRIWCITFLGEVSWEVTQPNKNELVASVVTIEIVNSI